MPCDSVLVSWVGTTDLRASEGDPHAGIGPIAQGGEAFPFDEVHLLPDFADRTPDFVAWLSARCPAKITVHPTTLSGPTAFGEIHEAVVAALDTVLARPRSPELTFHLSPGTPAMAAVWIILAKTRFPARLIESSAKHGARVASVPFNISAEFIPSMLAGPDARPRERLTAPTPRRSSATSSTPATRCAPMARSWRCTAARSPRPWSNPNSSTTRSARSPAPPRSTKATSSEPTAVRCSSRRSANSTSTSRSS